MTDKLSPGEEYEQDQRLVQDLGRMFHDERGNTSFLATLYKRLEAQQANLPAEGVQPRLSQGRSQRKNVSRLNASESRPWQRTISTIAAVLIMALLVGSLIFILNRTRQTSTVTHNTAMQTAVNISTLHMLDQQTGWAMSDKGQVLRTTDGGLQWKNVSPLQLTASPVGNVLNVSDVTHAWVATPWSGTSHDWIASTSSDPPHISVASTGEDVSATQIFRTSDGGQTWQNCIVQTSVVTQIAFINAQTGWLLSRHGISESTETVEVWHSSDGGQSWNQVAAALASSSDTPAPGHLPFGGKKSGLSFLDGQTGWITGSYAVAGLSLLYRTHDGGKTWYAQALRLSSPETTAQLAIAAPRFFSTTDGILPVSVNGANTHYIDFYVTHDGGNSWQRTAPIAASASISDFVDANYGWTSDGTHLYASSTGGKQWTEIVTNPALHNLSVLNFVTPTVGWAIGSTPNQGPALLKTSDGGQSWTVLPTTLI